MSRTNNIICTQRKKARRLARFFGFNRPHQPPTLPTNATAWRWDVSRDQWTPTARP